MALIATGITSVSRLKQSAKYWSASWRTSFSGWTMASLIFDSGNRIGPLRGVFEFLCSKCLLVKFDGAGRTVDDQVRRHRVISVRNRFHCSAHEFFPLATCRSNNDLSRLYY